MPFDSRKQATREVRQPNHSFGHNRLDADVGHHSVTSRPIAFSQLWGSQSTDTHAAAMCGYCGASARIKFDDEQFAALFNELQARGDKTKLMQVNDRDCFTWYTFLATIVSEKVG